MFWTRTYEKKFCFDANFRLFSDKKNSEFLRQPTTFRCLSCFFAQVQIFSYVWWLCWSVATFRAFELNFSSSFCTKKIHLFVPPSTTISSDFTKKGCSLWLPKVLDTKVLDNSERLLYLTRYHSLLRPCWRGSEGHLKKKTPLGFLLAWIFSSNDNRP